MSTEELSLRDAMVFRFAKAQRIPMAWNLAGGYQKPIEKVLVLHENTVKEWMRVTATFC